MDGRVVTMSKRKIEEMKLLAAKFIFTSGTPFNVANNKYLKLMFRSLGMPLLFPERHLLADKYLPLVYSEARAKKEEAIKGECTEQWFPN